MLQPSPSGPEDQRRALLLLARAVADSLELKDVFERVAEACRLVVPLDGMGVSLFEPGGQVRVYATAGDPDANLQEIAFSRADFSPALRPEEMDVLVVRDVQREVDPAYAVDRRMIERGYRSLMRVPLHRGGEKLGALVLVSSQPDRFGEDHPRKLTLVAELLTLALSHGRLAEEWRRRRQRRDALERLVPALTGTLDVREVFDQISKIAQEIVPHDYLSLGLLNQQDPRRVQIHAKHGRAEVVREVPEYPVPAAVAAFLDRDFVVTRDTTVLGDHRLRLHLADREPGPPSTVDLEVDDFWWKVYTDLGIRSALRIRLRLNGVAVGGLEFNSSRPDAYDDEDAEFAGRVAEHVALALAHQRLAEESRRATAAQDRATHLEGRVQLLARELESLSPHRALGRSRQWKDVLAQATKVAPTDTTVLITGESGTGKEVVARFLHRGSARKDGPFVALNCAALPEQLLESELFGHEKGAFTGALSTRPGRIEQASGGVLFLDEVGEMSPAVQAKFLRVLQEREFQRLGGTKTLKADVRVLAATNRNLKAAINQGGFREDLYYRLAVFDIGLPPLRERPEDVLVLAEAFLEEIGRTVGRPAGGISEEVKETLQAYPWPGNVRELRNALERAVILCEGGLITSEHLPVGVAASRGSQSGAPAQAPTSVSPSVPPPGPSTLDAAERDLIEKALAKAGNNKSKAARLLGLTRAQLRSRIEKHGLRFED